MKTKKIVKYATLSLVAIVMMSFLTKEINKSYPVFLIGNSEQIIYKKDLSANFNLSKLYPQAHLYGIGPSENLAGEMIMLDGKPYYATVVDGNPVIKETNDENLIFFIYAQVKEWKSIKIDRDINSKNELVDFVLSKAKENNLDISFAFPFLLEGNSDWMKCHISHIKPEHLNEFSLPIKKQDSYHFEVENTPVTIIGFSGNTAGGKYAMPKLPNREASKMHIHFLSKDHAKTGHVENLKFRANQMTLKLPVL